MTAFFCVGKIEGSKGDQNELEAASTHLSVASLSKLKVCHSESVLFAIVCVRWLP